MKKLNKRLTILLKESLEDAPAAPIEELKKEAAEFEKNEEARQDRGKMLARRDKLTDKADRSYFELEAAAISQHIYISDYIRGLIASAMNGKLPADQIRLRLSILPEKLV